MQIRWGIEARTARSTQPIAVEWQDKGVVNAHCLIAGMSGSGKTTMLRKMIDSLTATASAPVRIHLFDVHGDIEIEGASSVMFSEQTEYGFNPLRVDADEHFGGVRKKVQGFLSTLNRVMRQLGPKQEAVLRNLLLDVYKRHGFDPHDPRTWDVDDGATRLVSDGSDGRLYIDVPIAEKDEAKALGARWDSLARCWHIDSREYQGAITRWPPKLLSRTHPSITDVLRTARYVLQMTFLGTGHEAITQLGVVNKASAAYQKKTMDALRQGERQFADERLQSEIEKAKSKAIDAFSKYANEIQTGREVDDILKYDSTEVLKSVVDRLENLDAIGIFKATPPPFDSRRAVWRYDIKALSLEERKLFVLFRLEELYINAAKRGVSSELRELYVLDEAHIFCDDDEGNIIRTIAKEARKFGVGLICASQSPTHFPEDFMAAVATKVILGIDEQYWALAVRKMGLTMEALKWIKQQQTLLVQQKAPRSSGGEWKWVVMG